MTVDCEVKGQIGFITLNRPQALHALNLAMIETISLYLERWQQDPDVCAVVIQATPGKAFCAGGDIRWIYEQRDRLDEQLAFFKAEYRLNQLIHDYPKPYIALMDGITMGGGVGIALHGSHPIASEHFVFAMPETAIGFFPDIGASYLLSRCLGQLGIYLGLTGERLTAGNACGVGLVTAFVMAKDHCTLVNALQACDLSSNTFQQVDACVAEFAQPIEAPLLAKQADMDACFGLEDIEHILANLYRMTDAWYHDVRDKLITKSPMSLKVTLQQLRQAASLDLRACLKMDEILVQHFLQDKDFYEGVRALVIDKDHCPNWQPADLTDISQEAVNRYFI